MATFSRVTLAAFAAGVALGVSGCVATPAAPAEPEPVPSASPVFASEEEALAAATEAYAAYLEMSDLITSQGGVNPARIEPFLTAEYREVEVKGFSEFQKSGLSTHGKSTFDSIRLQQDSNASMPGSTLTAYLCADVSAIRLVTASEIDVTPADRTNRVPLEVDFLVGQRPGQLLIDRSVVWAGSDFC